MAAGLRAFGTALGTDALYGAGFGVVQAMLGHFRGWAGFGQPLWLATVLVSILMAVIAVAAGIAIRRYR
jgi:hypothetical protein